VALDAADRPNPFQSLHLDRERLREQIASHIQEMIAANQLRPGDQLPSERELAKSIGVNRGTVREAIRLLEQRGLIELRTGSGAYVTAVPSSNVTDSIERYFVFGACSHEDLIKLREILDPEIAALAAERATADEMVSLRRLVERIEVSFFSDTTQYAADDAEFHMLLARASHNDLIIAIMNGLHKVMVRWILAQSRGHQLEGGARSHRAVCDAITRRGPEEARQAMRVHHQFTRSTLNGDQQLAGRALNDIARLDLFAGEAQASLAAGAG
jgi:GntR family transcriptional repressor for pyruvate dehydrogenase complex